MEKMKQLIINDETWFYDKTYSEDEFGHSFVKSTNFYREPLKKVVKNRYKYLLFGEKTTTIVEKEKTSKEADFRVRMDIEGEWHTKADVRNAIERAMELMYRKQEIENGEII